MREGRRRSLARPPLALKAFEKAEALYRHARYLGIQPSEFALALTDNEARELREYLTENGWPRTVYPFDIVSLAGLH